MANATTTVEPKAKTKVKRICGVNLKLAKTEVLQASLKALDLPVKETDAEMITDLAAHFEAQQKKGVELLDCSCGGESPKALDACPFCGDKEMEEEVAGSAKAGAKGKPEEKTAAPEKKEEPKAEAASEKKEEPKPEEGKRRRKVTPEEQPGLPGLVGGTQALATTKPTDQKLTQVVPSKKAPVKVTEADLDRILAEIEQLKLKGVAHFQSTAFHIGKKILEAYETEAWKQRTEKGKPVYKAFDPFVQKELGMTHAHAWNLMKVAKNFTEEQVSKFGATKLTWVLSAPEGQQERLLKEHVEKGASVREVKEEATKAREKHGAPKSTTAKTTRTAAAAKANTGKKKPKKEVADKITISKMLGRERVHLFTSASMKGPKNERKPVKATTLAQGPVGSLDLPNDVRMNFAIVKDAKGTLALVINTERVKD